MKIYHYHSITSEFLYEGVADESPLEPGVYLIPAYATNIEPPEIPEGKQVVFISGVWELQDILQPEPQIRLTVDELRAKKRTEINAERDRREQAGFMYKGKKFNSDTLSVQRILIAAQSAQAALTASVPFSLGWTTADNSVITLDAAEVIGLPVTMANHANALHVVTRQAKSTIDIAEREEEMDAIIATIIWPE